MTAPVPYLDLAGFKLIAKVPPGDVDLVETQQPGFVAAQIELNQAIIDSRLRKRYSVPFDAPAPAIVRRWLAAMTAIDVWDRRGRNGQDPTMLTAQARYDEADAQMKEAADSKDGLFDLPLRQDVQSSGVTQGGPMFYSETSPYAWTDEQECVGRQEDHNRSGTGGTTDVG